MGRGKPTSGSQDMGFSVDHARESLARWVAIKLEGKYGAYQTEFSIRFWQEQLDFAEERERDAK